MIADIDSGAPPRGRRVAEVERVELLVLFGFAAVIVAAVFTTTPLRWYHLAMITGAVSGIARRAVRNRIPSVAIACTVAMWAFLGAAAVGMVLQSL